MNPYVLTLLAILTFVLVTEELATHWLQLQLSYLATSARALVLRSRLQLRLRLDRYAFQSRSPLAAAIREWQLRQIQNNPTYQEFFPPTTPDHD